MVAWEKQKELLKEDIPSVSEVIEVARNITPPVTQALFIIEYLTAGRVSEVTKNRIVSTHRRGWEYQGVKKTDFTFTKHNGRDILLIRIPNRKHRKIHFKQLPIPIDKEKPLIKLLTPYLNSLNEEEYIFSFGRRRALQLLHQHVGINNHYIRHVRLSHLCIYHDFNEQLLVKFAGWSDSRPASVYVSMRWQDILQKY